MPIAPKLTKSDIKKQKIVFIDGTILVCLFIIPFQPVDLYNLLLPRYILQLLILLPSFLLPGLPSIHDGNSNNRTDTPEYSSTAMSDAPDMMQSTISANGTYAIGLFSSFGGLIIDHVLISLPLLQ